MRRRFALSLALRAALVSLLALMVPAPAPALENPAIQVHLADGTSLLLLSWTFSYEYQSWRSGEATSLGTTARRDAKELWTGKKAISLGSQALELQYVDRMREVDGQAAKVPIARGFALVSGDGKRNSIKAEPPHQDLLAPEAGGRIVQARAMDLRGQTIGGTQREFCLLSYSSLVECPAAADQRVVRIKLQQ
jgi:hypothetical protein